MQDREKWENFFFSFSDICAIIQLLDNIVLSSGQQTGKLLFVGMPKASPV